MDDHDRVDHNLTNHTPDALGIDDIKELRVVAKALGHQIVARCPSSRERSLALTALEETVMWSVASIVRAG